MTVESIESIHDSFFMCWVSRIFKNLVTFKNGRVSSLLVRWSYTVNPESNGFGSSQSEAWRSYIQKKAHNEEKCVKTKDDDMKIFDLWT